MTLCRETRFSLQICLCVRPKRALIANKTKPNFRDPVLASREIPLDVAVKRIMKVGKPFSCFCLLHLMRFTRNVPVMYVQWRYLKALVHHHRSSAGALNEILFSTRSLFTSDAKSFNSKSRNKSPLSLLK